MTLRRWLVAVALLTGVVAVSSALARGDRQPFTVTSTLDGESVLPLRIHWTAEPQNAPSAGVAEVDFFIDGFHAWTEHSPPWEYGDHGNWLITTFLQPGVHTFTVHAISLAGEVAIDKVKARVIVAPQPPRKFAGVWKRNSLTVTISNVGWATGPNHDFDVRYLPNGNVVMGPEAIDRPEQTGVFCGDDPLHTWKVAVAANDKSMRLDPLDTDPCRNRVLVM